MAMVAASGKLLQDPRVVSLQLQEFSRRDDNKTTTRLVPK